MWKQKSKARTFSFPLSHSIFLSSSPVRELWDSGVGKICNFVRKRRSHLRIGHFWVPKTLTFNEAKCLSNLVKMSFICMRMKNPFHIKGWPLNLFLIQRPRKLTRPSFFSFLTWRIGCVFASTNHKHYLVIWNPLTSFRGETSGGVTKCRLFQSRATIKLQPKLSLRPLS